MFRRISRAYFAIRHLTFLGPAVPSTCGHIKCVTAHGMGRTQIFYEHAVLLKGTSGRSGQKDAENGLEIAAKQMQCSKLSDGVWNAENCCYSQCHSLHI
ncbi:hypothetical protein CEXT_441001 [Caerostris extrusa]|uniref:Secreted protein n=1 Tax=Caerostris extrusa TaxID=172846 RepID=A0AAV4Y0H6_CAEEX|nr:hypothetical protein CEXT_441001 [Caerostris extrusa]